jgi:hypothetical protein
MVLSNRVFGNQPDEPRRVQGQAKIDPFNLQACAKMWRDTTGSPTFQDTLMAEIDAVGASAPRGIQRTAITGPIQTPCWGPAKLYGIVNGIAQYAAADDLAIISGLAVRLLETGLASPNVMLEDVFSAMEDWRIARRVNFAQDDINNGFPNPVNVARMLREGRRFLVMMSGKWSENTNDANVVTVVPFAEPTRQEYAWCINPSKGIGFAKTSWEFLNTLFDVDPSKGDRVMLGEVFGEFPWNSTKTRPPPVN